MGGWMAGGRMWVWTVIGVLFLNQRADVWQYNPIDRPEKVDGYDTFLTQRARVSPIGGKNEIYSYFWSWYSWIECRP